MDQIDGHTVEKIVESEIERVEFYKHGNSLAITTKAVREGDSEAIHITFDELMNLLVDIQPHFRGDADDDE